MQLSLHIFPPIPFNHQNGIINSVLQLLNLTQRLILFLIFLSQQVLNFAIQSIESGQIPQQGRMALICPGHLLIFFLFIWGKIRLRLVLEFLCGGLIVLGAFAIFIGLIVVKLIKVRGNILLLVPVVHLLIITVHLQCEFLRQTVPWVVIFVVLLLFFLPQ
jgi:hypothetical protein